MTNEKGCDHVVPLVDVFDKEECVECVLERLREPLRFYAMHINESDQEQLLHNIKKTFELTDRNILLMGWAWSSWKDRNPTDTSQQVCKVCGCTDDNCDQCVDASGEACYWVESDLCSRCLHDQGKKYAGCCCFKCGIFTKENDSPDCACEGGPAFENFDEQKDTCKECPKKSYCDVEENPGRYIYD